MPRQSKQDKRIEAVLAKAAGKDFPSGLAAFHRHLRENLRLPLEVTGVEDFQWEEYYLLGMGDLGEYRRLQKTQPSFEDVYDLLRITPGPGDFKARLDGSRKKEIGRPQIPSGTL